MWRKKVDNSIFRYDGTTIPRWMVANWELEKYFPDKDGSLRKGDKESQTSIRFNNENFEGHLTCSFPKNRSNKVHRLWISEDLKEELKRTFVMSHMRDIESGLRGDVGDIEKEIPFWEFVDIEFLPDKGVLLLSFEHYSPYVSFYILKTTIEEFNKYKKDKNKMKSRESIIYLQDLQAQATNQVTRSLANSVIERELSKTAYMNIPSYEYLEIIESPIEPKFKTGPRRTLIVLLMTFLGFLLSMVYVVFKNFFRR